jgi:tetratricopeptide (TPR) repeat protein
MVWRWSARPVWSAAIAALLALVLATPAFAQGGMVKGTVRDDAGKPVEGATVILQATGSAARKFELKTSSSGEFFQIGLQSGTYTVTVSKDGVQTPPQNVNVKLGAPGQADIVIPLNAAAAAVAAKAKAAELKKLFDEAVAASGAGRLDEALDKFKQAVALVPDCFDCYNRIGSIHAQKKEYPQAEAAYKRSAELKPDNPMAYSGLASVYNSQGKSDLANQASAKAIDLLGTAGATGAGADASYNQGVILWNQGKVAEAKAAFQKAIEANPSHADAHFQLGMALVNEGNTAAAATEFEAYLKLAPDGPQAPTAKSLLGQLKP